MEDPDFSELLLSYVFSSLFLDHASILLFLVSLACLVDRIGTCKKRFVVFEGAELTFSNAMLVKSALETEAHFPYLPFFASTQTPEHP